MRILFTLGMGRMIWQRVYTIARRAGNGDKSVTRMCKAEATFDTESCNEVLISHVDIVVT